MTSLEERVARVIRAVDESCCVEEFGLTPEMARELADKCINQYPLFARAAIAVCAEEMAKVAETHSTATAEMADAKYYASASSAVLNCGRGIAAAIRSMGERG